MIQQSIAKRKFTRQKDSCYQRMFRCFPSKALFFCSFILKNTIDLNFTSLMEFNYSQNNDQDRKHYYLSDSHDFSLIFVCKPRAILHFCLRINSPTSEENSFSLETQLRKNISSNSHRQVRSFLESVIFNCII